MKFFVADYTSDTRILPLEVRAIWMDFLSLMHGAVRRGYLLGPTGLPLSDEQIAAHVSGGCTPELVGRAKQLLVSSGVASCTDDGIIFNRRMVNEEEKSRKAHEDGKKGGNPSLVPTLKGGVKGGVKGSLKGGVNLPLASSFFLEEEEKEGESQSLESKKKNKLSRGGVGGPNGDGNGFAEFWQAYPRKAGKENARKAWKKLAPTVELLRAMLDAIARQQKTEQWQTPKFIPHPGTWLNGRRWEDEDGKPPAPTGPTPISDYDMAHGTYDPYGPFQRDTHLCRDEDCEPCAEKRAKGLTR